MVSKCIKDSPVLCHKTTSGRNKALQQHLSTIFGSSNQAVSVQVGNFVKLFNQDIRLNILNIGNVPPVEISPEHMVAMNVDLQIP